jgi:hypothetical protein
MLILTDEEKKDRFTQWFEVVSNELSDGELGGKVSELVDMKAGLLREEFDDYTSDCQIFQIERRQIHFLA